MKLFSTGEAATAIGVHRDKIDAAIRSKVAGAPRPSERIGYYYAFTERDVISLCDWFEARGIKINRPNFSNEGVTA